MSEISIMIIGAITQQGSCTELKGTLGRVVMFLMFLAFLFMYTSYSANIVALLQSSSNQIKTLADLLNSKLEMGIEDTPYNRYHFTTATEPVTKAIYEKKIAPPGSKPNFMSLEEGVKKLQKTPFAFNMFLGVGYKLVEKYFLEHEKCGLQEIACLDENKPWHTCRKNSPFKEMYKIGGTDLETSTIDLNQKRIEIGYNYDINHKLKCLPCTIHKEIPTLCTVGKCSRSVTILSPLIEMQLMGRVRLLRNQEHGMNSRENRLIYSKKPICSVHGGTFDSVNMTDFYPALLMLVYGTILSLVLLILEILHSRRSRVTSTK